MEEIKQNAPEIKKRTRKRKSPLPSTMIKIRIDGAVVTRARELQKMGRYKYKYENEFLGYLVELGIQRYERIFLPLENGDDLRLQSVKTEPRRQAAGE